MIFILVPIRMYLWVLKCGFHLAVVTLLLLSSQHPDDVVKQEVVSEVIKQFHIQMDHVPIISLYDSDKGMALNISNKDIEHYMQTTRSKKGVEKKSHVGMTSHVEMKDIDIYQL